MPPRETIRPAGNTGTPNGHAGRAVAREAAVDPDQAALERGDIGWLAIWMVAAVYCATMAGTLASLLADYAAGK
jgi:hypothetical protein